MAQPHVGGVRLDARFASPAGKCRGGCTMNRRVVIDRLIVLVLVIAGWQLSSIYWGTIWFSSPWRVLDRFLDVGRAATSSSRWNTR